MLNNFSSLVILVCSDGALAKHLLEKFYHGGINVVGPAVSASTALALAALKGPSLAIIADPPAGKRNALVLADELDRGWGVKSIILEGAMPKDERASRYEPWAPRWSEIQRIRSVLGTLGSRT